MKKLKSTSSNGAPHRIVFYFNRLNLLKIFFYPIQVAHHSHFTKKNIWFFAKFFFVWRQAATKPGIIWWVRKWWPNHIKPLFTWQATISMNTAHALFCIYIALRIGGKSDHRYFRLPYQVQQWFWKNMIL